jgi:hypothetical protein
MRLARSVVAGLVVGVLAGFAVALLRPREIGSSQPVAPARRPAPHPARQPAGRVGGHGPTDPTGAAGDASRSTRESVGAIR